MIDPSSIGPSWLEVVGLFALVGAAAFTIWSALSIYFKLRDLSNAVFDAGLTEQAYYDARHSFSGARKPSLIERVKFLEQKVGGHPRIDVRDEERIEAAGGGDDED